MLLEEVKKKKIFNENTKKKQNRRCFLIKSVTQKKDNIKSKKI